MRLLEDDHGKAGKWESDSERDSGKSRNLHGAKTGLTFQDQYDI